MVGMRHTRGFGRHGRAWLLAAVLASAWAPAGALAVDPRPAAGSATEALDRAIAALPSGWSVRYAGVSAGDAGALVLRQVVISHDGKLLLAAARVAVAGLRGDGSAAAPWVIDRLEATTLGEPGGNGAAADSLILTGFGFSPGDTAGLPPGSRAARAVSALTALRVGHAVLTGFKTDDGGIAQASLDQLGGGKFARAVASGLALDHGRMRIADLEADDADLAWLVRVFDPTGYPPKDARPGGVRGGMAPAIARLSAHGFSVTDGDGTTGIESVMLAELQFGRSAKPPAGRQLWAIPSALGSSAVVGITHQPADPDGVAFTVGSIGTGAWQDGRLDALRVAGLSLRNAGADRSFSLQAAVVRGIDARGLLDWTFEPEDQRAPVPPTPRLDSFALDGLSARSGDGGAVTVAHVADHVTWQDGTPVGQDVSVKRLHVPTSLLAQQPGAAPAVAAFGRDAVDADLDFNVVWDPSTHDLRVAPLRVDADALGSANLTLTFGNVDLGLMQQGSQAAVGSLIVATVKGGQLVYQDHSLVDRVLAAVGALQGKTADELRQGLLAMLAHMKSPLPSVPRLPAILASFLRHPGTLTVTANPASPIPAATLAAGNPAEVAGRLGLSVTATPN